MLAPSKIICLPMLLFFFNPCLNSGVIGASGAESGDEAKGLLAGTPSQPHL